MKRSTGKANSGLPPWGAAKKADSRRILRRVLEGGTKSRDWVGVLAIMEENQATQGQGVYLNSGGGERITMTLK